MEHEKRVSAVLSVKDNGYFSAMQRAQKAADGLGMGLEGAGKKTTSFKDTMLGMASAIGVTSLISKGFDMISASVGKAMARADTMDNFRRTMTLMTGSTDKAGFALDDLKGKVSGTAYGLDVAAKATQGLVTSGLDIKTSTKYIGGWLDAVSTYGDGTNETLGNVTFQLSQMASKGKANLGDLKSAMEAGIPVIKIYAEATGQSTQEVSDQISKGVISSEKFMQVMDEAFRSGTKSFAKIEGAAKKAGGTWKGTFDNMQAATTRGMLSIIEAIDKARADANLPGMKDAIAGFGKSTEAVLKNVAGVAGFVAKHFEALSSVLVTGLSAWAGYKVFGEIDQKMRLFQKTAQDTGSTLQIFFGAQKAGVTVSQAYANAMRSEETASQLRAAAKKLNIELEQKSVGGLTILNNLTEKQKAAILAETGALTLKNLLTGVMTGKITLATAAQIAWNIAMKANPIGMIVAGVAALVGVLTFLNKKLNETSKEHRKANQEAEDMASTNKSLVDSTKDLGKSYQDNSVDAQANAAEAKRMVDGLIKLQKATMNTEEKQMRMKDAVAELNSAYPELNVSLDKTGTAIEGSTDAIYKQIDAMKEQAKMEAMKEFLKDLYKKQIKYGVSIDATNKQMAAMTEEGTNAQKTWFGLGSKTTEEFKKLEASSGELTTGLTGTNAKIAEMESQLNITSEAQLRNRMEIDAEKSSLEALNEKYGVTTFAIKDYADVSGEELEKVGTKVTGLAETYGMSADKIMEKVKASGVSLEDWAKSHDKIVEAGKKYEMTAVQIEEALDKTGLSLEDWAKQQDKLLEISEKYKLNTTVIQEAVRQQGISLDQFAENHENNLNRAKEAVEDYTSNATNGWEKLTQNQTISLTEYMKNMEANRKAQANWWKNLKILNAAGVDDSIIDELERMGPAGADQLQRFVDDLYKGGDKAGTAYDDMGKTTKKKVDALNETRRKSFEDGSRIANDAITNADWPGKGARMIDETATGMANKMSGLRTQAENTGGAINKGITSGVDKQGLIEKMISSGRFAMEGLDDGMNEKKQSIYSTAATIARNISSKFRAALEINSPSGVFRKSGNYIDDGVILGMEDGLPDVSKMSQKLADTVASVDLVTPGGRLSQSTFSSSHQGQAAQFVLNLGKQSYKAFVEDITRTQDREIGLELKYT